MAGMRTGSMMPPRDGNGGEEELLAKVIPLRRRGGVADGTDRSYEGSWGIGREPAERESPEWEPAEDELLASTVALERSIWDQPSARLVRRPQGTRQRVRRALSAHALRVRELPTPAIVTVVTGLIALAALVLALDTVILGRGGSQQVGGSVLQAHIPTGSRVDGAEQHPPSRHLGAKATSAHRHGVTGRQRVRSTRSARSYGTASAPSARAGADTSGAGTAASTPGDEGTGSAQDSAGVGGEHSGSSGDSASPSTYTTAAAKQTGASGVSTSSSTAYTPVQTTQSPPPQSEASERGERGTEASASEFGFEH